MLAILLLLYQLNHEIARVFWIPEYRVGEERNLVVLHLTHRFEHFHKEVEGVTRRKRLQLLCKLVLLDQPQVKHAVDRADHEVDLRDYDDNQFDCLHPEAPIQKVLEEHERRGQRLIELLHDERVRVVDVFVTATISPAPAFLLWVVLIERLYVVRHVVEVDGERVLLEKLNAAYANLSVFGHLVIWIVLPLGGIVGLSLLNTVDAAPLNRFIYLGHYNLLQAHTLRPMV